MKSTRRNFLQASAGLLGLGIASNAFASASRKPRLCFTTLGTPDWTFNEIVRFAKANHYEGLELRGILRELDLTKCKEFSPSNIAATRRLMQDAGLKFAGLGASTGLHMKDPADRKKNIDEAKRFIDLAEQIDCPGVRVFPNSFPKDQEKAASIDLIAQGLTELAQHAKGSKVKVLMESHGDVVLTNDIVAIMEKAAHPQVGLVWDIVNMWSITKESPALVYPRIAKYVHHTHIKDEKEVDGKIKYVLMGEGETPIFEAIRILLDGGYNGFYSFEWEKLWHPEIEGPEIALAGYAKIMKERF